MDTLWLGNGRKEYNSRVALMDMFIKALAPSPTDVIYKVAWNV